MKKSIQTILAAVVLLAILSSCTIVSTSVPPKAFSEHEAMSEIYSVIISDHNSCKDGELTIVSILSHLLLYFDLTDWQEAKEWFPKIEQETWENFTKLNEASSQIISFPSDLDLGCNYSLVNIETLDDSEENCTSTFFFSPIGFNSEKNQALVAQAEFCGGYGLGYLYLFEIVDGHWTITSDPIDIFIGE